MTIAFGSSMTSADVDSFLSQTQRPPQDAARAANNSARIPIKRPLLHGARPFIAPRELPLGDDTFNDGNVRTNAPVNFTNNHHHDDDDDDDYDTGPFVLPRLMPRHPPTTEEILAKHIRLTTVYDLLQPPPDDEETREGTALGLRPDAEDRLFYHQTMRLGRWCGMTGQRVERDQLLDFEKELLDWKFERPAAKCRVPFKEATGRGCMGGYLRRRNRIPKYEIVRRRTSAARSRGVKTPGSKWPQARGRGTAAEKSPSSATRPRFVSNASNSLPTPVTGGGQGGSPVKSPRGTSQASSSPSATAAAFQGWRASKARNEAMTREAAASPLSPGRGAPKSPVKQQQQQQQGGLPPRFLMADGRVNTSKVLDEQMDFIANGGRAEQFFTPYPGLQDIMARPDLAHTIPGGNTTTTNTPPRTTVKPGQPRGIQVPATSRPRDYRRARVTELDDAGNEIANTTNDDSSTATANFFARQRFANTTTASRPVPAVVAKSLRLDRTSSSAITVKNVSWAPLPERHQEEEGNNNDHHDDGESVEGEIPRDVEVFSSSSSPPQRTAWWSPGGTLSAGRAGRGRYGRR